MALANLRSEFVKMLFKCFYDSQVLLVSICLETVSDSVLSLLISMLHIIDKVMLAYHSNVKIIRLNPFNGLTYLKCNSVSLFLHYLA